MKIHQAIIDACSDQLVLTRVINTLKFGIKNLPILTTKHELHYKHREIFDACGITCMEIKPLEDYELAEIKYKSGDFYCHPRVVWLIHKDPLTRQEIKQMLMDKYKLKNCWELSCNY